MKTARLYFLDNLRAFVVFLVIVLHGSLTYMAYAPEWWYVLDPQNSLFFTMVVLLVDVPIMLILFFVAGYFAFPSLARRGQARFVREKFIRIGLPWIFGVLLLAPPTAYMIYYSRQVPVSLGEFWRGDFWGPLYQQSVYWYLGILLLFFVLLTLLHTLSGRVRLLRQRAAAPGWRLFAGFLALTSGGFLLVYQLLPLDMWSHVYLFVYQPVRIPVYVGYFVLGIVAFQRGWFTSGGYMPSVSRWLPLVVLSGVAYLGYRLIFPEPLQTTLLLKAGTALLFNLYCLSALLAGVAIFYWFVNGNGPFWRSQARNSYGIYYLHPLFLYPLAYAFVPLSISIYVKAITIILLAWVLSWAASALVLTRLPGLRRVF